MIVFTFSCNKSEFDQLVEKAEKSGELGNYDEALNYVNRAEELKPEHENLTFLKSKIYASKAQEKLLNEKEFDEAILYAEKAISNYPGNDSAYNTIGGALMAKGKYKDSIQFFLKELEIDPESPTSYHSLANSYRVMGDYKNSLSYYYQALERQKKIHSKLEESLSIVELHRFLEEFDKSKAALEVFESYFNSKEAEPYRSEFYERYQYSKEFLEYR